MTEEAAILKPRASRASAAKKKNGVWGWVRFVLLLAVAMLILHNLIGLTRVSGHSMDPTLQNGSVLLVDKLSLFLGAPEYGDVVTVKDDRLGYTIVKRVIAVGGDRVAIREGVTYVNEVPLVELYTYGTSEDMAEQTVGKDDLFVAGDNRTPGASLDSRDPKLGTVHISDIKGYALMSLVPFHKISKPLKL
ncbi:signal peptidase I [Cohnella hashimotonis]|uniref:Signal peptidase I n=1 Tax=Cohnella hashimotonis TaxID=2826895 RepID=A0ABT6TUH8_9BACL|nr:signal peptidase I [Cohnella hashimotonis]MDI4649853.1 signal peptidase I [Cohnella hashimotonis]